MKISETVNTEFGTLQFVENYSLGLTKKNYASLDSCFLRAVVLVALTDKFNALFHHGNFPVG